MVCMYGMYVCMYVYTFVCMRMYVARELCTCPCVSVYMFVCMCSVFMCVCVQKHTTHTYIHTSHG